MKIFQRSKKCNSVVMVTVLASATHGLLRGISSLGQFLRRRPGQLQAILNKSAMGRNMRRKNRFQSSFWGFEKY